jgi:hypothetical protein
MPRKVAASVPYQNATSGDAARGEISKLLRHFGAEKVGFMDNFEKNEVILQFTHRGRPVSLRASAKGWAAMFLKSKPYGSRTRGSRAAYEAKALAQGFVAINSILRDWVKGQVTAVECGMLEFEAVFMPYMLMEDGRTFVDHARNQGMLPPPEARTS